LLRPWRSACRRPKPPRRWLSGKSEKTFAANARKRAGAKRVKKMVAELQKPAKEKIQQQITAKMEWATQFTGRHLA